MQAFEFSALVENNFIRVPESYADRIAAPVRVIILSEEIIPQSEPKKQFTPVLDTRGYKFNREELHERQSKSFSSPCVDTRGYKFNREELYERQSKSFS